MADRSERRLCCDGSPLCDRNVPLLRCTGRHNCIALTHTHGCYADSGRCDAPAEHAHSGGDAR